MKKNQPLLSLGVMLVLPVLVVSPLTASAQLKPWTSVGSAGTVDEADTGIVVYAAGIASMKAAAVVGAVLDIRYNVVAVDDVAFGGPVELRVRFRDAGASERVVLRLKGYDLATGATTTLLTFDSNLLAPSASLQDRRVFDCSSVGFDFGRNAYYIEAQLTKAAKGGNPQLGAMQVSYTLC